MIQSLKLEPEKVYHIYNRANGNDKLFFKDEDYYMFLDKYAHYVAQIVETYCYCLIPNHFHLLVKIKPEEELKEFFKSIKLKPLSESPGLSESVSKQFGNLFSSYTQTYNKKNDRKGSMFIPRFKRKPVEDPEYFTQLVAYIHTNPIKHGLTNDLNEWQYSSYHAYTSLKNTRVKTDTILDFFGGKDALVDFHKNFNENLVIKRGLDLE